MASLDNDSAASRTGKGLAKLSAAIAGLRGQAGFWLKALSQPTIDLTLRTHAKLHTRIIESPGLRRMSTQRRSSASAPSLLPACSPSA